MQMLEMWGTGIDSLMGKMAFCPPTIPDNIVEEPFEDEFRHQVLTIKQKRQQVEAYIRVAIDHHKGYASAKQIAAFSGKSDSTIMSHLKRMKEEGKVDYYERDMDNGSATFMWYWL